MDGSEPGGIFLKAAAAAQPAAKTIRIVAFGDSLTAGYGLRPGASFPARLQAALRARGYDVTVANAGVSGDTSASALARVGRAVPADTVWSQATGEADVQKQPIRYRPFQDIARHRSTYRKRTFVVR